jgi:hypothetical protein
MNETHGTILSLGQANEQEKAVEIDERNASHNAGHNAA